MPIRIPNNLPAREVLEKECIPYIRQSDALQQDIRPLEIALLNLMPDKIKTENQILRAIGSNPLQINLTLLRTASYTGKTTSQEHLQTFYQTLDSVQDKKFDGFIMTGAPIAHLQYEDVDYWGELQEIFNWVDQNVYSSFYICWGALAALYHHYGIQKYVRPEKTFGLYRHKVVNPFSYLVRGFDDYLDIPVSRYSALKNEELEQHPSLEIVVDSDEVGVSLLHDKNRRHVFMMNHLEYEVYVLNDEYQRDKEAGLETKPPANYFPDGDETTLPPMTWRAHRMLLFQNWVNIVYQGTPYDLEDLPKYKNAGWLGMKSDPD